MDTIKYFDYYKAAADINIPKDIIHKIEKEVKVDKSYYIGHDTLHHVLFYDFFSY